ncbi:quinone oxidoreductase family protein [Mycobacterium sp. 050134]|uniref:quinone oxidoreductase family protein n=1 Tax=Mycobacterium sp. 050134 TaxID=3096111 RepID=UPI002ED89C3B
MKAIQYSEFGGPEVLRYVDVAEPVPDAGEVLIATEAIGVNFPDIRERLGTYNRSETRVGGVTLPHIGGIAVAGRVVAVGPGGDTALMGLPVVALTKSGGYAQLAVAAEELCAVVDDDADLAALAGFAGQAVTAHLLLRELTSVRAGESVLVHAAAGGVGSMAVQIAKSLGARPVIGTAGSIERQQYVREIGADAAVPYDEPGWTDRVLEMTGGRGVDVIIESIGGDVFEQNFAVLAPFGRYLLLGSVRGPGKPFEPRRLMAKSQALIGLYLPGFFDRPDAIVRALRFLAAGLRDGAIKATPAAVLPLSRAAEAHRQLEHREVRGVVVLEPKPVGEPKKTNAS